MDLSEVAARLRKLARQGLRYFAGLKGRGADEEARKLGFKNAHEYAETDVEMRLRQEKDPSLGLDR